MEASFSAQWAWAGQTPRNWPFPFILSWHGCTVCWHGTLCGVHADPLARAPAAYTTHVDCVSIVIKSISAERCGNVLSARTMASTTLRTRQGFTIDSTRGLAPIAGCPVDDGTAAPDAAPTPRPPPPSPGPHQDVEVVGAYVFKTGERFGGRRLIRGEVKQYGGTRQITGEQIPTSSSASGLLPRSLPPICKETKGTKCFCAFSPSAITRPPARPPHGSIHAISSQSSVVNVGRCLAMLGRRAGGRAGGKCLDDRPLMSVTEDCAHADS